jgi:hypothetical protein
LLWFDQTKGIAAMSKLSAVEVPHVAAGLDIHVLGSGHALEAALSVLKGIDARYEQDRAGIEKSAITAETKTRVLHELDLRHRRERESYLLTIADLHG